MLDLDLGLIIQAGHDPDGWPEVQVDHYGEDEAGALPMELIHWHGFHSLPHNGQRDPHGQPIPDKACRVLYGWQGPDSFAFPIADARSFPKLPKLGNGGTIQYGGRLDAPTYALIEGGGAYRVRVPAGATITLEHASGPKVTVSDSKVLVEYAASSIEVSATGVTVSAPRVSLGASTGLPLATAPGVAAVVAVLVAAIETLATKTGKLPEVSPILGGVAPAMLGVPTLLTSGA